MLGRWVTLASAVALGTGGYRIDYTPKSTGTWRVRLDVAATTTLLAGATTVRSIQVT